MAPLDAAAMTKSADVFVTTAVTATGTVIGGNETFGTHIDGRMAHVKMWNAVLTDVEIEAERQSLYSVVRSSNLHAYWKLLTGSTALTATNGSDLTNPDTPTRTTATGAGIPTVKNGTSATTTWDLAKSSSLSLTVKDAATSAAVNGARVLVLAAAGGDLPVNAAVTITRASTTATVTHTAHGYTTGQKVVIKGANQPEYNGIKTITVATADTYTYTVTGTPATPATGTILATTVLVDGTTDANGLISATRSYTKSQPFTGRVRRATTGTLYRTAGVEGTVVKGQAFSSTIQLIQDQ
jgi:hypothetical protein